MLEAITSFFTLQWSPTKPKLYPLPTGISRTYIINPSTPNIRLELLSNTPSNTATTPPILFIHGGFGHAAIWLPFISHLPTQQCYALSTRSHGASTPLCFAHMVWGTGIDAFTSDIVTAIKHIETTTGQAPILVAHSSGGGLAQYLLSKGLATTPALVLLDAVPHFGGFGVHANWAVNDPWFGLRVAMHGYHPRSPLSTVGLIRGAFFGGRGRKEGGLSDDEVKEFGSWMADYESLLWPMQMFGSFGGWLTGRPKWLDVKDILRNVTGLKERVCVIVGDQDVLMDVPMMRRMVGEYREGVKALVDGKKIDGLLKGESEVEVLEGAKTESEDAVRFVVVEGAGHHAQNDVQWEVAAEALKRFIEQV